MLAHRPAVLAAVLAIGAFVALPAVNAADAVPATASASLPATVSQLLPFGCNAAPKPHAARCFGTITASSILPNTTTAATGLSPAQIQSAYKLAGLSSGGKTVAIVDAFDDKKAEA